MVQTFPIQADLLAHIIKIVYAQFGQIPNNVPCINSSKEIVIYKSVTCIMHYMSYDYSVTCTTVTVIL